MYKFSFSWPKSFGGEMFLKYIRQEFNEVLNKGCIVKTAV